MLTGEEDWKRDWDGDVAGQIDSPDVRHAAVERARIAGMEHLGTF
jgi:hypothetical protein